MPRQLAFGPIPESISSCGVLKAPPDKNDFPRRARLPLLAPDLTRLGVSAIQAPAFEIFDADAAMISVEENSARERIELDMQFLRARAATSKSRSRLPVRAMIGSRQRHVANAEGVARTLRQSLGSPLARRNQNNRLADVRSSRDGAERRAFDDVHHFPSRSAPRADAAVPWRANRSNRDASD